MGRNIFTSLIVLFLLVVLAACGQGGTNAAADNNPSPENGQANGQYSLSQVFMGRIFSKPNALKNL